VSFGGPPAGSPFAGPSSTASSQSAGLPFAGIPSELLERVKKISDSEPEHPEPEVHFSQSEIETKPFTLRRFVRPHLRKLTVALALVVIETLALLAGPVLTEIGIDDGITPGNTTVLIWAAVAYLVTILVNTAAGRARIGWTARLGEQLMYQLRIKVFSHFQRLSIDFFTDEKAGRLMSRMTSDIEALTILFQDGLINMAVQGLTLVIIMVVLYLTSPVLATVMLITTLPVMLASTVWFRSASDRGYARVRDRIADVLADLQESLSGIRIITAHNRRRHNVVNHQNVVGEHLDANLYTARIGAIYGPGTEALGVIAQAVVVLVGGKMVLDGSLSIGELTLFILYLAYFFAPIQQLVQLYNSYQQGQAAIGKLRDVLETRPGVPEKVDAVDLPPLEGRVDLDDVTFSYKPGQPVLHRVDLHIAAGETFALVGPTGAGKSTVAKLVSRFYDPDADHGSVAIDGYDLRDVTFRSLRSQLGIVPQEPFLFHGSIRDNVAFARPDASHDDILDACRAVGIDDLVERLPHGLDTPVHERGASLSSGERQLLALARAFLARPRVLILDEATSNLDLRSEAKIERALDNLLEGRTAIIIAHRLATAMRADRIAVIDDGGVIELGTPDELVAADGEYAEMYRTWMRDAEVGSAPAD
jgi:ATP-binding cassette subfamily B protein